MLDQSQTKPIFLIKKVSKSSKRSQGKKPKPLRLKNHLPFLRYFNPQYTKRENIDKKIIREFKGFISNIIPDINNFLVNYQNDIDYTEIFNFWNGFTNDQLTPPMQFTDNLTKESFIFKSFNTNYLNWIFSRKGADELYEEFLNQSADNISKLLVEKYELEGDKESNDEILQLDFYIRNMINIYKSTEQNSEHSTTSTKIDGTPQKDEISLIESQDFLESSSPLKGSNSNLDECMNNKEFLFTLK